MRKAKERAWAVEAPVYFAQQSGSLFSTTSEMLAFVKMPVFSMCSLLLKWGIAIVLSLLTHQEILDESILILRLGRISERVLNTQIL
jgi:hypothetical protein